MTYNSSVKTVFVVHKVDCTTHVIMPSTKGLFFSDVKSISEVKSISDVKSNTAHVMIDTLDTS